MVFIFFTYGLAFFLLGVITFIYPKKNSQFKLAENLWLISLFGIFHGVHEWLDMFILISPMNEIVLKYIRMVTLPVSFFFLVQFGINNIVKLKNKKPVLQSLPILLFAVWMIITATGSQKLLTGDIAARYLLCFPGTLLTFYALILHLPSLNNMNQPGTVRNLKLAAGSFLVYGFLSGLIVPQAQFFPASIINYGTFFNGMGIPVQVFRTICAMVILYAINRILNMFEWETIDSLRRAHDELENRVMARTASLQELNDRLTETIAKVRTLFGLLPICASCKKIRDDRGYWNQIEAYISEHSEAEFTHGICPDCAKKMYQEYLNITQ